MKRSICRAMLGFTLALASTAVLAEVLFDPASGTGFVGKGDVQDAFGWNDAGLQAQAAGVTFTYGYTAVYEAVCTFTTGEGTRGEKTHHVPHAEEMEVSSAVDVDLRRNRQSKVTGFTLTGYGDTFSESGEVPVVGGPCPGNPGHGGVWTSVELLPGGEGGLYASYGDQEVLLAP